MAQAAGRRREYRLPRLWPHGFTKTEPKTAIGRLACASARAEADMQPTLAAEISDQDYGDRGHASRHPEGRLWRFGGYDPWQD